jgi:hypothetical protein
VIHSLTANIGKLEIIINVVTALFISVFEGRMFSRWIVTNITSALGTMHSLGGSTDLWTSLAERAVSFSRWTLLHEVCYTIHGNDRIHLLITGRDPILDHVRNLSLANTVVVFRGYTGIHSNCRKERGSVVVVVPYVTLQKYPLPANPTQPFLEWLFRCTQRCLLNRLRRIPLLPCSFTFLNRNTTTEHHDAVYKMFVSLTRGQSCNN